MGKGVTMSRRQRRSQLKKMGYLKIKNMFGRFSEQGKAWYSKMSEEGINAHDEHVNRVNDSIGDQLQTMLNNLKLTWKDSGYNDSEIGLLEEAWSLSVVKNKDTYRKDKKEAIKLRKEAQESLKSRLNANS